jgi:hypothetical protein
MGRIGLATSDRYISGSMLMTLALRGQSLRSSWHTGSPSDNMRTCELEIGEKKTIFLMAEDNVKGKTTLLGCYYFYAK